MFRIKYTALWQLINFGFKNSFRDFCTVSAIEEKYCFSSQIFRICNRLTHLKGQGRKWWKSNSCKISDDNNKLIWENTIVWQPDINVHI